MFKTILLTAIALSFASPAIARTITVPKDVALDGTMAPVTVHVDGGGVNLDFSQLNEQLYHIILDDPSRIGYSHCLLTKSCGSVIPPLIHIRRIDEVKLPGLPRSSSDTLMTVITRGRGNTWNTYLFPLVLGNGTAPYNKVSVVPPISNEQPKIKRSPLLEASAKSDKSTRSAQLSPELSKTERTEQKLVREELQEIEHRIERILKDNAKEVIQLRAELEDLQNQPQKSPESSLTYTDKLDSKEESNETDLFKNPTPIAPKVLTVELEAEPEPSHDAAQVKKGAISEPPEIVEIAKVSPDASLQSPKRAPKSHANALANALVIERNEKKMALGSWEWRKLNTAIALFRRGKSIEQASKGSDVPVNRLAQLIKLGGGNLD